MGETTPCDDLGHDFHPLDEGYFKPKDPPEKTSLGTVGYDQTVTFYLLYCKRCGTTKEVRRNP